MTDACRHHWQIEPPDGPTSRGRCRNCSAEREFLNWTGERTRNPSPAEVRAIATAKREERAINTAIRELGQGGYTSLGKYRRNFHRDD